jgi:hypothetical protein
MDAKTQVTSVHGHQVLDLALLPLEANFALPLVHEIASKEDRAMLDIAVAIPCGWCPVFRIFHR